MVIGIIMTVLNWVFGRFKFQMMNGMGDLFDIQPVVLPHTRPNLTLVEMEMDIMMVIVDMEMELEMITS